DLLRARRVVHERGERAAAHLAALGGYLVIDGLGFGRQRLERIGQLGHELSPNRVSFPARRVTRTDQFDLLPTRRTADRGASSVAASGRSCDRSSAPRAAAACRASSAPALPPASASRGHGSRRTRSSCRACTHSRYGISSFWARRASSRVRVTVSSGSA